MNRIPEWWASRPPASRRAWELAALLAVPVVVEIALLGTAWRDGILGIDVKQSVLPAAQVIRDGYSPFARLHYPPLLPVLLVPLTFVPSAAIVVSGLALATVAATLWVLDVRDWRCYGAAFLWAPVVSGIQTANATLFLVLASALAWRYRDRAAATAAAVGLAIAAKLISWPLAAWLAATGRIRGAVGAVAIAVVSTIGLGALLEIALRHTDTAFGEIASSASTPSYSVVDVSRSLGATTFVALLALALVAFALVSVCVVLGRRGDDVGSFSVACLTCLVGGPNVWLHSFALILPVVALTRPRFSAAWLVPVLFLVLPVVDPSAVQVAFAWLVTCALALRLIGRPPYGRRRPRSQTVVRGGQ